MTFTEKDEKQIAKYIRYLGCTREEAIEELLADKEVDKMTSIKEINADLTDEQIKNSKAMRTTTTQDAYGKTKKVERKANDDKAYIMSAIMDTLKDEISNLEVVNGEREITFTFKDVRYKITLSCPRK